MDGPDRSAILRFRIGSYEWQAIVAKKEAKNALRSSQSEVGLPMIPIALRFAKTFLCTTLTFCAQFLLRIDSIMAAHRT